MSPLVVLNLGQGSCETGLPGVTARLWLESSQAPVVQYRGSLPPVPELPQLYKKWKQLYEALHSSPFGFGSNARSSIEFEPESLTNVSRADFRDLCEKLKVDINHWLNSSGFRNIDQQLRTKLGAEESIRLIIETDDLLLQKLPWHLWRFLETYDKAEVALSSQEYEQVNSPSPSAVTHRMRILVILGHSDGINIQPDRMILEDADAETVVLKEPPRSELDKCLWDKRGWDIFFFAGHSTSGSDGQAGELFLNSDERLSIGQLKHALTASIKRGLKLAIFNSCDGLGLARDLADLNLPQLIVMREPVVDQVAQTFLQNFLRVFSDGEPFYTAVRHAREQLQGIEGKFPCASWLPVIFQNPTETPMTWGKADSLSEPRKRRTAPLPKKERSQKPSKPDRFLKLGNVLLSSVLVTLPVVLGRALGLLHPLELPAYDHLMRSRPVAWDTKPAIDPRLLVIEITEDDTDRYGYPVSDELLATALANLEQHQPRAIGIDLHRYQANPPGRDQLLDRFKDFPNIVTVCSFGWDDREIMGYPPEFSTQQANNQVGFSDLETDNGFHRGHPVVRRQLLSYDSHLDSDASNCTTPYSLSLNLALRFLKAEGIQPLAANVDSNWQLGPVVFKRLAERTGAYQGLEGDTSDVLLNYRFTPKPAQHASLNDVLEGKLDDALIRNRIVLIGVTDEPVGNDYRETPFGKLPGVWVHAHSVSQIFGAVLDGRPLIAGLPQWGQLQWGDMLWTWTWALVGGVLVWRIRSVWLLGATGVVVVLGLRQICLVMLVQGTWVPFIPALLALLGTAGVLFAVKRGYLLVNMDVPLGHSV
ncbi:MAG: CHASE2 domain-containing protein [Leptolyngbya sp. SIO3F4]|nr:CHASE2 domain-containing protein [Leptolyngbya sp. SIO3F4]